MTLEFEGNEPVAECLHRYRYNFGRLLVLVHLDGLNFSEHMIAEGYSPYFNKYGHAGFAEYHRALHAERSAQAARRGPWDQVRVNGSEPAQLCQSRRRVVAAGRDHRRLPTGPRRRCRRPQLPPGLRGDCRTRPQRSGDRPVHETPIFRGLGLRRAAIDIIGSQARPFQVFISDIETEGMALVDLVHERYLAEDEGGTAVRARRSYAHVQGPLQIFRDAPEVVVPGPAGITDAPPAWWEKCFAAVHRSLGAAGIDDSGSPARSALTLLIVRRTVAACDSRLAVLFGDGR